VFTNVREMWSNSNCGYKACEVNAFSEEKQNYPGLYRSRFGGNTRTPFQYWDGSHWNTVSNLSPPAFYGQTPDYSWTFSLGGFPSFWTTTYGH
jgi:hypothetical protein